MEVLPRHTRYEVLAPLGQGGMGTVWRARDRQEGQEVALKTLRSPDEGARARFSNEIQLLSSLRHEGIVRLHDVGRIAGELFYTMELLEGVPLDRLIVPEPAREDRVRGGVRVLAAVLDVLGWLHDRGILHGDLKPANVVVSLGDADGRPATGPLSPELLGGGLRPIVHLVDFGVAREMSAGRAALRAGEGTPLYMAPEQLRGEPSSPRADLFSAGAILYHFLAGRPPRATLAEISSAREPPPSLRSLGVRSAGALDALDRLLGRLLDPRPGRRPESALDVAAELRSIVGEEELVTVAPRLTEPAFVGRKTELDELVRAFDAAAAGRGLVLPVEGGRGDGKSWLLHRGPFLVHAWAQKGAAMLRVNFASPERAAASLDLLLQNVRDLLDEADEELRSIREASPAAGLVEGALFAIEELARRMPVVLAVEDAHAPLAVSWLERIEAAARELPVLVAVPYRPEDVKDGSPLRELLVELRASGRARAPLCLGEFSDRDLAEYVEAVLAPRRPPAPGLLASIARLEEAHPSQVHRHLRELIARGSIRVDGEGRWELAAGGRGSESKVPAAETHASQPLPPEARQVLAATLGLGEGTDAALLQYVLSSTSGLANTVKELRAAGYLIDTPDGLVPRPGPELDRIRAELSEEAVRSLHARAAEFFLSADDATLAPAVRAARAARHLEGAREAERAAESWLDAGRRAAVANRNEVALSRLGRAFALAEKAALRVEIAFELGDLKAKLGDASGALETYARSEPDARDVATSIELADRMGRVLQKLRRLDEAKERFARTLELAGDDGRLRGRALLRLAGIAYDEREPERARALYDEALELVRSAGAHELEIAVLSGLGVLEKSAGSIDQATLRFEEALGAAERAGRPLDGAAVLNNLGNIFRLRGRSDDAVRCFERSIELRERGGDRRGVAICFTNLAAIHGARGELAAAERATERALEIFTAIGDRKGVLIAGHNLAEFTVLRGRFVAGEQRALEVERLALREGAHHVARSARLLRASIAALRHGPETALAVLETVFAADDGDSVDPDLRRQALALRSELLDRLDREAEASENLAEALAPSEARLREDTVFRTELARLRALHRRGKLDDACALGRELLERLPPSFERLSAALVHRELGTVYRDLGPDQADRTERHLAQSIEEFEAMECPHEAAEALRRFAEYWRFVEEPESADLCEHRAKELLARAFARPENDANGTENESR